MWLDPGSASAHWNRALAYLQHGDFERGWPEYEWRWKRGPTGPRQFPQPAWDGSRLNGRTALLYTEQGYGDMIQFVRYASHVQARGGPVLLECPPALIPLFSTCRGIDQLVPERSPHPPFDVHAALMSLPGLLGTTLATVPADIPYLHAQPARIDAWAKQLAGLQGFKVGVAWQGNPRHTWDRFRSFPLASLEPIAHVSAVQLVSLQKGLGAEQLHSGTVRFPIIDLGTRLDENGRAFLDTAAVMAQLDLVITADTATAHLAGSLGVPVWVALSALSDWRWLRDRDDSPWYPTMRLFRQKRLGDWADVFGRMAETLAERANSIAPERPIMAAIAVGELIDKITILEIKNEHITDDCKRRNVQVELGELAALRDRTVRPSEPLAALTADLKRVNETLWEVEDVAEGGPNPDFGTGGMVTTEFVSGGCGYAYDATIQSDGKIVVVGDADANCARNVTSFAIARYNADGTLDDTFGSGGKVMTSFGQTDANADAVVIQDDGKIVVAGSTSTWGNNFNFVVARYNSDGTLDDTFGNGGIVLTSSVGPNTFKLMARDVALQPDGKIVVTGNATGVDANGVLGLARYNTDGTLDDTFGTGGVTAPDFGAGMDPHSIALQSDGALVVAGLRFPPGGSNSFVGRFNPDGSKDLSFGTGGGVSTDMAAGNNDYFNSVFLQADGRILAVGNFGMARYSAGTPGPIANAGGPYSVPEGGSVQLDASATMHPTQDPATLVYEWDLDGDGFFGETGVDAAHGDETGIQPTFSAAGLDGPSAVNVKLRVTDADNNSQTVSVAIDVTNVAPTSNAGDDQTVNEAALVNLHGTATDPGIPDTLTFGWHVVSSNGQVIPDGVGPDFSFTPNDNGVYTVTLTVTDDDGDSNSDEVVVTVENLAPTAVVVTGPATTVPEYLNSFTLSASDPSPVDQADDFTFAIDWDGDGTNDESVQGPTGLQVSHAFPDVGQFTVKVTATDKDGDTSAAGTHDIQVVHALVLPDPNQPGFDALFVYGTAGDDDIEILPAASGVEARLNSGSLGTFQPTGRILVFGRAGNDTLTVAPGITQEAWLRGEAGNDTLTSASAGSRLLGGADDDRLIWNDGAPVPVLDGEDGADTFEVNGADGADAISVTADAAGVHVQRTNLVPVDLLAAGTEFLVVNGGLGNDTITAGAGSLAGLVQLTFNGQGGNDSLVGGDGGDRLDGGAGNDRIFGKDGNDTLTGGPGRDTVVGGAGTDRLFESFAGTSAPVIMMLTQAANARTVDKLSGLEEASIVAGSGNDRILASAFAGPVTLDGGAGNDTLTGGARADVLIGGSGNDLLGGGGGNDLLLGAAGNDLLGGGGGNDILLGGSGNDRHNGGGGRDLLLGGSGLDRLNGGGADDILFGGLTTFHDEVTGAVNLAALAAVMAEWSQTGVLYGTRIDHLDGSQSGGQNGGVLLNNLVLSDDAAAVDSLSGGFGLDWFLTSASDLVKDPNLGGVETINSV